MNIFGIASKCSSIARKNAKLHRIARKLQCPQLENLIGKNKI